MSAIRAIVLEVVPELDVMFLPGMAGASFGKLVEYVGLAAIKRHVRARNF